MVKIIFGKNVDNAIIRTIYTNLQSHFKRRSEGNPLKYDKLNTFSGELDSQMELAIINILNNIIKKMPYKKEIPYKVEDSVIGKAA